MGSCASAADAAPKKATYKLTLTGTQLTTWEYHKRQQPSCDWPEEGHGDQEINFYTRDREPVKITVTAAKGGGLTFDPAPLNLEAYTDNHAEWKRLPNPQQPVQPNDVTTGKTILTWNATFKRVR